MATSLSLSWFFAHDIAVIAEVADQIGVMYAGRLVELGSVQAIFKSPRHPYTAALMSAYPSIIGPKTSLVALAGDPPDLLFPPPGCRFHPRCAIASQQCRQEAPSFISELPGHFVACWNPLEEK